MSLAQADRWVFFNGSFVKESAASIPVSDLGFLFGDGVFTTARVTRGVCELALSHMERLRQQARLLNFEWEPFSLEVIEELISLNDAKEGVWRLKIIVTAREVEGEREAGNVLARLEPAEDLSFHPCSLSIFPTPIESPLAHIKHLAYLDRCYIREYARKRGDVDALVMDRRGYILETGCANVFWFYEGKWWMPDSSLPYLKGLFLNSLLPHLHVPIEWVRAEVAQIPPRASVYISNCLMHVRPVVRVERILFQRNPDGEALLQEAISRALQRIQ